jgi:outer membrane lipoprotein-sorting protein
MKKRYPTSWEFGNLFKEPGLLQPVLEGMKTMDRHIRLFGIIAIITCLLLMSSGCTEQKTPSTKETLQALLEKAAILESVYYKIDTSFLIDGVIRQNTTTKIWQKTPYLKEEENTTSGNISTTQTIIKRPEGLYLYDPMLQIFQLNAQMNTPQPSTAEMVSNLLNNQTLTIVGTENISSIPTTIIQYHPNQGGNSTTVKLWIWNEKGVPLKEQYISNSEGISVTIDSIYSDYSFEEMPESLFSVE